MLFFSSMLNFMKKEFIPNKEKDKMINTYGNRSDQEDPLEKG